MESKARPTTGARLLVDALVANGTDRVFCVPGESYLAVLDALYDRGNEIEVITCRQEGGAAMMADADGKLTGRPGIVMATRGPGACNASAGLHVAMQDSTPLILFVGQVARGYLEREAFQEIDYRRMFGQVSKWVAEIDDAARVPEFVARAFAVATSGRPGPVVLAIPEDMLEDVVENAVQPRPPQPIEIYPSEGQISQIGEMLKSAQRPLLLLGGTRWTPAACEAIRVFAEAHDLPVMASFRRQDKFDNTHPNYVGEAGIGINPKLKKRFQESDLLIVLGAKLSESPSGSYTLLDIPNPRMRMVHVHSGADELNKVYHPELPIVATPVGFTSMLGKIAPTGSAARKALVKAAREDYEAWQKPPVNPGPVQMGVLVRKLWELTPPDTIVTNGAGNFAAWTHRFHRYRGFGIGTQLASTSGSMGYGIPAAVAAKLRYHDRLVICVAGDGDYQMTGQELATAAQFGAPILVIVIDNGMLGTIRAHQERHFPGRVSATTLVNPDFAALARAYGGYAELVEETSQFDGAFERARASGKLSLLHVKLDPEAISAAATITSLRAAAQGR